MFPLCLVFFNFSRFPFHFIDVLAYLIPFAIAGNRRIYDVDYLLH